MVFVLDRSRTLTMTLGESPFAVILTPSARTIVILRCPPAIVKQRTLRSQQCQTALSSLRKQKLKLMTLRGPREGLMSMRRLLLALVALIDACRSDTLNRRYAQPLRSLLHRQLLPTAAEPQPPGVLGRNRLQRLRGGGVSSAPLLIGIDGGTESIRGNILVRKSMRRLWERDSDCSWSICSGRFSRRRHAGRRCLCILPDCFPKARLG